MKNKLIKGSFFLLLAVMFLGVLQNNSLRAAGVIDHLNYLAHKLTAKEAPATLAEWEAERAELRANVMEIIGLNPMPEKTPLNIQFVGEQVDLGNCYFQRVVFESLPKVYVAAHLYIPKGVTFPVPAVIHVPGHGRRDGYRAHPRTYAENGFVAIGLPMVGEEGKVGAGWGACGEYGPYKGHFNWYNTGYTPVAATVWSDIRSVDFLLTLEDSLGTKLVNENKIGMAGLSGGAGRTLWMTIADPRISVAVVSEGATAIEGYNSATSGISSTCDIHLFYNYYGFSYGEMYSLIAPRKFLLINGTLDGLYPNPQPVVDYLTDVYALYDSSNSFSYKTFVQGHGYSTPVWNEENNWMDKWLRSGSSPLTLYGKFDATLTCFPGGEPSDMAHVETVFTPETPEWNIENQNDFNAFKDTLMDAMRSKILRTAFLDIDSQMKTIRKDSTSDYNTEKIELSIDEGSIVHQGYYLYKPGEKRKTMILISKNEIDIWSLKSLFSSSYLHSDFNLFCLEITGTGHNPWSTASHYVYYRFGEICGQTQTSLQVNDLVAAVNHIKHKTTVDSNSIYLWGSWKYAVPALYGAVVNGTNVAGVVLENAQDEHIGITPVEASSCNTAVFNILKYADIPQVAGLLYPRTIILNGKNKQGFDWTENMYSQLDNANNFVKMDGLVKDVLEKINMVTSVKKN